MFFVSSCILYNFGFAIMQLHHSLKKWKSFFSKEKLDFAIVFFVKVRLRYILRIETALNDYVKEAQIMTDGILFSYKTDTEQSNVVLYVSKLSWYNQTM